MSTPLIAGEPLSRWEWLMQMEAAIVAERSGGILRGVHVERTHHETWGPGLEVRPIALYPGETSDTRVVHVNDHIPGAVYIGRAMPRQRLKASPFANPHKIGPKISRDDAITLYEHHLVTHRELWAEMPSLRAKPLACWCRHDGEPITADTRCHGDVLVNLLATFSDDELLQMAQGTYD